MVTSLDSATAATLKGRTLVLCFDGTSNQYDGDVGTHLSYTTAIYQALVEHQRRQVLLALEEDHHRRAAMLLPGIPSAYIH